jgi:G patch domain-containing protein 2
MGGGKARPKKRDNSSAGGPTHGNSGRRPRPSTTQILFKHESRGAGSKASKNAGGTFGYIYPSTSDPVEIDTETEVKVPTYSYHPAFSGDQEAGLGFQKEEGDEFGSAEVSHLGLGFVEKEEEEEVAEMEAMEEDQAGEKKEILQRELDQLLTPEVKKGGKSEGFLSIGGYRVYTEDTSSPEEDMDDDDDDDVSGDDEDNEVKHSDDDEELSQSDVDNDDKEEDEEDGDSEIDDSSSEIDDGIVRDYMEGIGGADEFLSGLSKKKLKELEVQSESDNSESSESDEDGNLKRKKLGGVKLMEASEVYGMKGDKWKGKGKAKIAYNSARIELLTLDNVVGSKNCRAISRRKKSAPSQLSMSWPGPDNGRRSKKYRRAPGIYIFYLFIFYYYYWHQF